MYAPISQDILNFLGKFPCPSIAFIVIYSSTLAADIKGRLVYFLSPPPPSYVPYQGKNILRRNLQQLKLFFFFALSIEAQENQNSLLCPEI